MVDYHKQQNADLTIAVLDVPRSEASRMGIMICDEELRVTEFEEKPKARFLLIKKQSKDGEAGDTYFPAFTDADELAKFKSNEPYQRVKMKFGDLAMLVEQVPTIKGFVINPMSHNLPFTRDMLDGIKKVLIKRRNAMQAANAENSGEAQAAAAEATEE